MKVASHIPALYKKVSKFFRKLLEHKQVRSVFHTLVIVVILTTAIFPHAGSVFGQTQQIATPSANPLASEEVIVATKNTSRLPVSGPLSQGFSYYHPGIDIEQGFNNPIYPFLSGIIRETGFQSGGYGNYVLIDHQNGFLSLYAHMNKILVKKDNTVSQDSIIGTVGVTGRSTGPHLHFEVYERSIAINPISVLPEFPFAKSTGGSTLGLGGPNTLPSRTLILPVSQQTPIDTTIAKPTVVNYAKKPGQNKEEQTLGIWLPNDVSPAPHQIVEVYSDQKVSHQLPDLIQF